MINIIKKIILYFIFLLYFFQLLVLAVDTSVIDKSTDKLGNKVYKISVSQWMAAEKAKEFIANTIWKKIMIPIIITIWLLLAFINFYKLKFSQKEEDLHKSVNYFTWWSIWIIIMVSSVYILLQLVNEWGKLTVNTWTWEAFLLYEKIFYPFLKLFLRIVVWILFLILLIHTVRFLLSTSEDVKKHSQTIIVWNIIWILLILGASNIVQLVYWKKDQLAKSLPSNLWDLWAGIFANKDTLNLIYNFINYFLSFVAFIVVVIIIRQAYNLLFNPEDDNTYKSLKKNIVYVFIGMILIVAGYLITNFVIIR